MKKPEYRLVAKHRQTGKNYEVAAGWVNDFGGINLKPSDESTEYKLPLSEVLDREEYYLTLWKNERKDEAEEAAPQRPRRTKKVTKREEVEDEDF